MITTLKVDAIKDPHVREAFQLIKEEFDRLFLNRGDWQFFEVSFTAARTNFKVPHKLAFMPKDILQTSLVGDGVVTWNYTEFDKTYLDLTATDACTVRFFAGAYR